MIFLLFQIIQKVVLRAQDARGVKQLQNHAQKSQRTLLLFSRNQELPKVYLYSHIHTLIVPSYNLTTHSPTASWKWKAMIRKLSLGYPSLPVTTAQVSKGLNSSVWINYWDAVHGTNVAIRRWTHMSGLIARTVRRIWSCRLGNAKRLVRLLSYETAKQVLGHILSYQKTLQMYSAKPGCQFCLPRSDILQYYERANFSKTMTSKQALSAPTDNTRHKVLD